MEVLNLAIGEDAVELAVRLELVTELGQHAQALLLPCQLQQVWALSHDGCAAGGHLEDLLLLALPCDHVELLDLPPV